MDTFRKMATECLITWWLCLEQMVMFLFCFLIEMQNDCALIACQYILQYFSCSYMSLIFYIRFCLAVSISPTAKQQETLTMLEYQKIPGDETCWWHFINRKVFVKKSARDQWRVSISLNIVVGPLFKRINFTTAWTTCDCFRESRRDAEQCIHV